MNGQAYQLDVTWDVANTKNGLINYDYFNLTDECISKDHFEFSDVPMCESTESNFFHKNGLFFENMRQLESHLLKGIQSGQTHFYFKMADDGHKMEDIIMAARSFTIAEASNGNMLAKVFASYKEAPRTGRIRIEPVTQ